MLFEHFNIKQLFEVTLFEIFKFELSPILDSMIAKRLENTFFFFFLMYDDKNLFKSGTTIISAYTETALAQMRRNFLTKCNGRIRHRFTMHARL